MSVSYSAEAIANNEHLISQILVLLPPKSLLRFKCVSKQWLSLISSPQFIDIHSRLRVLAPSALLLNNVPQYPQSIKILQSCNGLLLCYDGINYYICNPTTMQFKTIPFASYLLNQPLYALKNYLNLAFDPLLSPHFKILCITMTFHPHMLRIYDSRTNTWNSDPIYFDAPTTTHFDAPVFCRRALHWYSDEHTSIYFNVDKQCFKAMPMPQYLNKDNVHYFGESRGHLRVILSTASAVDFVVLEMEEDYSKWSLKYKVNLESFRVAFQVMHGISSNRFVASVLSVVPAAKGEEEELVLFVFGMVVSYNLNDGTLNKIMDLIPCHEAASHDLKFKWKNVFPFIQTLFRIR